MKKLFLSLLCATGISFAQTASNKLPTLSIDKNSITVSGVSAGGFMAIQLNVALSSVFSGVASVAGGVYWCAEGSALKAQFGCMKKPSSIDVQSKIKKAQEEEAAGNIEPLANLKRSRVYIYASPKDNVIGNLNTQKTLEFYSQFTPKENFLVRQDVNSGHSWVTKDFGNSCEAEALPWINNCQFDMAGEILTHMYGPLKPLPLPARVFRSNLYQFDQTEFNDNQAHLFNYGWIYIPKNCQSRRTQCKLHVALHGCQMSPEHVQDKFAINSGLNSWAEANNIVVLYPQDEKIMGGNPYACWDWWGYTNANYANRKGPQIMAIQKMVYRLLGMF